jgi:protein tyrosine/serine phosphatase
LGGLEQQGCPDHHHRRRGSSAPREFAMSDQCASDQVTEEDAEARRRAAWDRVIRMEAINNFRDYGDLPVAGGGRVCKGRLFRAAHLARASAADLARLAELGITTVTDLRHPSEQELQPGAWIGRLPIAVIEEPAPEDQQIHEAPHIAAFRESDFSAAALRDFLSGHYRIMPFDPRHVAMFRRYFAALAGQDGGMLIHCAAGKDRTGILAWLTHHVLGVHPDDAMADYLLSNDAANIAERLPAVRARLQETYGRPISEEAMYGMLTVTPEFIASLIDALTENAGSVDAYLADVVGLDAAGRDALRARLIV